MNWLNRKTMNEKDFNNEEISGEAEEQSAEAEFRVTDKRRVNADSKAKTENKVENKKAETKSPQVIELENKLRVETERREAAETKLVGVQSKFDEMKTQMERETAEMRSRMQKSLEDRAKQTQFNFLITLLPVLDNLNLAIDASETDASFEHLLDGVKGTARSFEQALSSVGVEAVESIGAEFNPEFHEAVDMVETDEDEDGKITAVYSHGYKFGERLLRPARVQVGKARAQSATE